MTPLVIAHRGGAAEGPENTLSAFDRALRSGADGIECDVHQSRDGVLMVHHDPALVPAAGADAVPLAKLTAEEIRAVDMVWTHGDRFAGEVVPTLDEVIDLVGDRWLMVEMKRGPDDRSLGDAVARRLVVHGKTERAVAASFSVEALEAVRSRAPELLRMGVAREDFDLEGQADLDLWAQGFLRDLVPGPAVDQARNRGRQVWTWTVTATDQITSLTAASVDALICDIPAAARSFLA